MTFDIHTRGVDMDQLLFGLGSDDLNDFDDLDDVDDIDDDSAEVLPPIFDTPIPPSVQTGFTTGNFKSLPPPSATALAKIRKIWDQEDNHAPSEDKLEEDPSKRRKLDDDLPSSQLLVIAPIQGESMFKTASNKVLPPPSTTAFGKVTTLFDEFTHVQAGPSTSKGQAKDQGFKVPLQTGAEDVMASASQSPRGVVASLFTDTPTPTSNPYKGGFTTGSGASASAPSAQSLARARAIFGETDLIPESPSIKPSTLTSSTQIVNKTTSFLPPSSTFQHATNRFSRNVPTSNTQTRTQKENIPSVTGFMTPSRTPLRTKTNTFTKTEVETPLSKISQPIQIRTPTGPLRRLGMGGTPAGRAKKGFVTPFKTPNLSSSSNSVAQSSKAAPPSTRQLSNVEQIYQPVFDLDAGPSERKDMKASFLKPGYYSPEELEGMEIPEEIVQLNLSNALFYVFKNDDGSHFGPQQALSTLKEDRCHLVTKKWVDNHWAMILWKIAGQIQASPELFEEKWSSREIVNQLKYRYEREYGRAQRPIIRRIQEQDSPPTLPMVLFVCAIHRPPPATNEEGKEIPSRPYLELSDGWYRINAELDECLARAVNRGRIEVGRKLAISGAKLDSSGEGCEVLDALDKSRLIISGNGTSLSPWHVKLGIRPSPFLAGLSSLSVDGGLIPLMDVMVEKLFPLAYMNSDKSSREAPWDESEEARRSDEWTNRREAESFRLAEEMKRRVEVYEDIAQALAGAAEDAEGPFRDTPPDNLDNMYDQLLISSDLNSAIRVISSSYMPHLARLANDRLQMEMSEAQIEIQAELDTLVPQREIRDFRMARIVDARQGEREQCRVGMLNIWEAKMLEGNLQEGKRYLVSNLVPGRGGDWGIPKPGRAEIYLHTRRDTRWKSVE